MNPDDRDGLLRYDELASRVYSESRMPTGTRDLILALGWVSLRDPQRHDPAFTTWQRTRDVLNVDNERMWQLIVDDAPRYEHDWLSDIRGCQAPMVRIDRLCGKSSTVNFSEFDPATGWMTLWGFCSRPRCREYAKPIHERSRGSQERAPKPIPNAGGLLPLFFSWNWEAKYRKAGEVLHRSWEPPSYGLSADEWPEVPGQEKPKVFPKLRLIASDGDVVTEPVPQLVTGEASRNVAARSNLRAARQRAQFSVVNLPRQTSPSKGDRVT
jgi:hypothetical protein